MKSNTLVAALAGFGLMAGAGSSHALLWTAPVPTPSTIVTFDGYDGFVTTGPEVVAPGVTFSGSSSTLGAFIADVGGNGIWGAGKVFAGLGSFFEPVSAGTMLFNFGAVATAGAFVNVFSPNGKVTISAFGAGGVLLESHEVTIDTPNGENAGMYLAIGRGFGEIEGLSFSGTGVVLDDLSLSTAVVPLPPAALLLAGGLAGMAWLSRRRKVG
ncbi:MAG: PEP-CTERM sorting domain-containing protein [Betaproteobacteria bacterium]|jgi:hypothetical protein|nr:PEP-CTERM sorting domain-containing protein [Betaproteobacteria bacterium]